ncbi:MAG: MFS transporter [Clostridiales bacterium]|nr:MFS transporter [Clostridiales bacterium]
MSEETNNKSLSKKVFGAEENSAASINKKELGKYSDIAIRMFHTKVLTTGETILPAIGELAGKFLVGLETYKTVYFVTVLKLDMKYVTLILTLIAIYDVLNNPLMGLAYDKTRTRWGKARPYLIFSPLPYFLSTFILFSGAIFLGNTPSNDPKKIIFLFLTLFAQETFSTIYTIPRNNMVTLMSPNPKDRITVGLLNTYLGNLGASIIYAIFPPVFELSNKGYINISMPMIFSGLAAVAAILGTVGNVAMAVGCKERIMLQPKPAPIQKTMFYVLKNKYARRNFLANFAVSWWSDGGYRWDFTTQQEIFGGSIPSLIAYMPFNIFDTLSITFIPKFQKLFKNNNKSAVLWLRAWDLLSATLMSIFGVMFVDKRWVIIAIYAVFHGLDAVNNGPANVFEGELAREINDYTEYMTGERPDGTINILTDLITKVTEPLKALLTIKVFNWSGYDPTIKSVFWSQGNKLVYQKMFFLFAGISLLPNVVKAIPYFFYDLTGEKREKMYIALNERRALMAKEKQSQAEEEIKEIAEMLGEDEAASVN